MDKTHDAGKENYGYPQSQGPVFTNGTVLAGITTQIID
jgi:hypothetical protein